MSHFNSQIQLHRGDFAKDGGTFVSGGFIKMLACDEIRAGVMGQLCNFGANSKTNHTRIVTANFTIVDYKATIFQIQSIDKKGLKDELNKRFEQNKKNLHDEGCMFRRALPKVTLVNGVKAIVAPWALENWELFLQRRTVPRNDTVEGAVGGAKQRISKSNWIQGQMTYMQPFKTEPMTGRTLSLSEPYNSAWEAAIASTLKIERDDVKVTGFGVRGEARALMPDW